MAEVDLHKRSLGLFERAGHGVGGPIGPGICIRSTLNGRYTDH